MRCPYKTVSNGFCDLAYQFNIKRIRCKHKDDFTSCPKLKDCKSNLVLMQKLNKNQPQPSVESVKCIIDLT